MGLLGNSNVKPNITQIVTKYGVQVSSQYATQSNSPATLNFKNTEITAEQERNTIQIYENVFGEGSWSKLSSAEQQAYLRAGAEGRLQKSIALGQALDQFHKDVKAKNITDPKEAACTLIELIATAIPEFNATADDQKDDFIDNGILKLIAKRTNLDITNMQEQDKELLLVRFGTRLQAAIYAEQQGKIDSLLDLANFSDSEMMDLEYDYAAYVKNNFVHTYNSDRSLQVAKEKGDIERGILAQHPEFKDLEELRASDKRYQYELEYLQSKPESELTEFEGRELAALSALAKKYNGDLTKLSVNNDHGFGDSYAASLKPNNEKIDWDDFSNLLALKNKFLKDYEKCESQKDKLAKLQEIMVTNSIDEELAVYRVLAMLESEGSVDINDLIEAQKASGKSAHVITYVSPEMSDNGASVTYDYYIACAQNGATTAEQNAGVITNIVPEYSKEVSADAMKKAIDKKIDGTAEAIGEACGKLDEEVAKNTYDYFMQSKNYTDEEKAIAARDAIDFAKNDELRNHYQNIANQNGINYNSVPAKSERNKTNNNTAKVENTEYTAKELAEILGKAAADAKNPFAANSEDLTAGILSTLQIILGKTPNKSEATTQKTIETLNSAINQLKSGESLNEVFKRSSVNVQRDIIKIVCTYGKIAIASLINTFGGDTIYNLAKTPNEKRIIKKEVEKLALSDSTQRTALAEIEKKEKLQGEGLSLRS